MFILYTIECTYTYTCIAPQANQVVSLPLTNEPLIPSPLVRSLASCVGVYHIDTHNYIHVYTLPYQLMPATLVSPPLTIQTTLFLSLPLACLLGVGVEREWFIRPRVVEAFARAAGELPDPVQRRQVLACLLDSMILC